MNKFSRFTQYGVALGTSALIGVAQAATDVTSTVSLIGEAAVAVLTIGAAVIAVKVGAKIYRWAASAL